MSDDSYPLDGLEPGSREFAIEWFRLNHGEVPAFPDWADYWLITEYMGFHQDPQLGPVLYRLICDGAMRLVWEDVCSQGDTVSSQFLQLCKEALEDFRGVVSLSSGDRKRRQKKIAVLARELASLLEGTNLDDYRPVHFVELAKESKRYTRTDHFGMTDCFPKFSIDLYSLAEEAEKGEPLTVGSYFGLEQYDPELAKPGDPHAARNFFAKYMTRACESFFGGPRRGWVLAATRAAFPDGAGAKFDDRQLRRIAPPRTD